ncbi:MAG: NADH-quinone oxidoreductase subunit N [Elusimicrobiota bacterium]
MILLPQAALAGGVLGALGLGLLRRPPAAAVRAVALLAPLAALFFLQSEPASAALPLLSVDLKSLGWQLVIYSAALPLALRSSGDDVEAALFLGAVLGMGLIAAAGNLPMLFIGLEFMSLPAYLLVARAGRGDSGRRLEAALKYFFTGALAGALFLLGMALYYSETRLLGPSSVPVGPLGQAGVALMAAAALFKIGAVPLHWWLPDVYEAAAPEVTGFLSTAMKSAAVLFLMRVVSVVPAADVAALLAWIGAVTSLFGAVMALRQERLARLLAYSSIAHAGLLVLGVGAWARMGRSPTAAAAILFYLGAYALMSNGTFGFLAATGLKTRSQLKGYAKRRPELALAFAVLLFSLGGVPPTGGFVAKLLVLWQAVGAHLAGPVIVAALAALVSLGYYLALVRDMYFEEPLEEVPAPAGASSRILVMACAFAALVLGAAPLILKNVAGVFWP